MYDVTIAPSPIIADPTGDPTFPYSASFTLTVRDTAGLSGNVSGVQVTFGNAGLLNFGASEVIRAAGTNHVGTRGSLVIPLTFSYRSGLGRLIPALVVTTEVIDDHGHHHNFRGTVSVVLNSVVPKE